MTGLRVANYLWLGLCIITAVTGALGSAAPTNPAAIGYLLGMLLGILMLSMPSVLALLFIAGDHSKRLAVILSNGLILLAPVILVLAYPRGFSLSHILLIIGMMLPIFGSNIYAARRATPIPPT